MKVKQILWTILFVTSSSVSAVKFENNSLQNLVGLAWTLLEKSSSFLPMHPDTKLNVPQFLAKYHYPLECHDVTTEDGYILTMHRIPHGRRDTKSDSKKPVVFFKHCFMCSSRDWLLLGPTRSLPMLLADQGYDVWLANTRGNLHSMKHKTLNPDTDSQFWDFSFHEKGYFDLPASIDYVIETTKSEKITYIGHSQGTTEAMVMTSTRPEYNEKFYSMILLSPVVYLEHVKSPLILLMTQYRQEVESFLYGNNIYGIPWNPWISVFAQKACNIISPFHHICVNILELIIGYDLPQLDRFLLTVLLSYTPAGFSVKELIHFGQAITSGEFKQFDYGLMNSQKYGRETSPVYDVSKITAPIITYYGKNDYLVDVSDVEKFMNQLPTKPEAHLIEWELFNHFDFIFAKNVKRLLYDSVIDVVNKYNKFVNK